MRKVLLCVVLWGAVRGAGAEIFGRVQGVVHDPQHRPVHGAKVSVRAARSPVGRDVETDAGGGFSYPALAFGDYVATVTAAGFRPVERGFSVSSSSAAVLHFELEVAGANETVSVRAEEGAAADSVTPTTRIDRAEIEGTPGADATNSVRMITEFVPGAYVTHDMLHIRGGHQVSWLLDGVQIPNTNIASNLGAQIDPKDIDYLETQRGSYSASVGDRTYGVFNVAPRNGFERSRDVEVVLSAGSFGETNEQVNFGDHTARAAWYASVNGNRSGYGLAPPVEAVRHDAANGYGGFASVLLNRTPQDQLRLVTQLRTDFFQIPYDPDPSSDENGQYDSSGLRDGQHETDGLAAFTWAHTFGASVVLQLSPFYHANRADYEPGAADQPVATTSDRRSQYAGLQGSVTAEVARHTLESGVYGFGQHDRDTFGSTFNDGSADSFGTSDGVSGGLAEEYVADSYKAAEWLTVTGGVRLSQFRGGVSEDAVSPRVGAAVRVPRLGWVVRGFYGRFYQPPPLLTASGPIAAYADSLNTGFTPLHGERDEEHQFGVSIPFRGWLLDADTFKTRANNFLDHANLGESSIYYPVSIDGALVQGWELTLRSPRAWRYGRMHLAYSNQTAKQRGALTGGLVCVPVASPGCSGDFRYSPLDHDQRNTLAVGYSADLPWRLAGSAEVSYGSGFHNGSPTDAYPGEYLPQHSSVDLSLSRALGEHASVSVNVLNVTGERTLLDNSLTFGGFHFNDPRMVYGEVRFRLPGHKYARGGVVLGPAQPL